MIANTAATDYVVVEQEGLRLALARDSVVEAVEAGSLPLGANALARHAAEWPVLRASSSQDSAWHCARESQPSDRLLLLIQGDSSGANRAALVCRDARRWAGPMPKALPGCMQGEGSVFTGYLRVAGGILLVASAERLIARLGELAAEPGLAPLQPEQMVAAHG